MGGQVVSTDPLALYPLFFPTVRERRGKHSSYGSGAPGPNSSLTLGSDLTPSPDQPHDAVHGQPR